MADKSFVVNCNLAPSIAYTSSLDETKLWHRRMRHVDYRSLSQMSKNNFVEIKCTNLGSMQGFHFLVNRAWRANEKLYLVHTNICGPMKTSSSNGSRYFVLFIDDYTRFCWVYFIKNRSKVVDIFFKFKTMIENQSGC
ncbi:golgin subfamily A member 3-like [Gossypium australe]|uniref:Golgin subfamily A member 3-like n=1 Tax=Gossypium australe TaxID=47621 RepID=A0A5B6VDV3_9ROSI|nr:golgin subfamily A member 3-like [Gossypium australe]